MATIHYPDHIPSAAKVNRLLGLKKGFSTHRIPSRFCVELNGFTVCHLPDHYFDDMRRFIWREEAIRFVLSLENQLDIPETLADNLKMVLWYMDTLFNLIVRDAASVMDGNSPEDIVNFQNDTFDNYLLIEYWARRHEPKNITKFRSTNDRNLDRSRIDECDWKSYEQSLGGVWSGADYMYTLNSNNRTEDIAVILLEHMVMFYDPPMATDDDFGYTFEEHLHHRNGRDAMAEDGDEDEDEDEDGDGDLVGVEHEE